MKLAIIIPYYRGEKYISTCLDSITKQKKPSVDLQVFIVDNDNTTFKLDDNHKDVEIIKLKPNIGFARAVNFGVYRALDIGFTHFIILNQDTFFMDDALSSLIEALKNNPQELITPLVYNYEATEINKVFKHYLDNHQEKQNKLNLFPAVCLAFNESFLKEHLLFDPVFFHYGEDYDFIYRNGLNALLLIDAKIAHFSAINEPTISNNHDRDFNYLKGLLLLNKRHQKEESSSNMILAHLRFFLVKKKSLIYTLKYLSWLISILGKRKDILKYDKGSIMDRTFVALKKDGFQNLENLEKTLNA